jgi:hypothetical protein
MVEYDEWATFDKWPEDTCYCRCGAVFYSHARSAMVGGQVEMRSRKSCPGCGRCNDLFRISGDFESFAIGGAPAPSKDES